MLASIRGDGAALAFPAFGAVTGLSIASQDRALALSPLDRTGIGDGDVFGIGTQHGVGRQSKYGSDGWESESACDIVV